MRTSIVETTVEITKEVATTVQETVTEALSTTTINDAIESVAEAINSVSVMDKIGFVVEIVGVIATVAAVMVALAANKKANDSIKVSIKMQEQAKNVQLYDKRLEIIRQVCNKSSFEVDSQSLHLLFNKTISDMFIDYCCYESKEYLYRRDLETYKETVEKDDFQLSRDIISELSDLEICVSQKTCPKEIIEKFKALSAKHELKIKSKNKDKIYNYYEIVRSIEENEIKAKRQKDLLIIEMRDFVRKSIAEIK